MSKIRVRIHGREKLTGLADTLSDPGRLMTKASEIAQETTLNLISEGFKSGTDPYGKPWDAPNDLQITGGIRSYAKGEADAGGFSVHATDEKAIWHHDPQPREAWGGAALPTRLQVPTESRGLPSQWASDISRAAGEAIAHMISKSV